MLIAIPAALALLVAGCSSGKSSTASPTTSPTTKAPTASVIRVGVIGSYSGEEANAEASAEYTIKAWANTVNAAGGLEGHPIKLYVEDDAGNVATSLTKVKTLVEEDHVVAIVGQATTNAASWAPYVQSKGIPVVGGNTVDLECISNPNFYNVGGNLLSGFYGITALAAKNGPKMGALYSAELPACAAVTSLLNGFGKSLGVSVAYSAGVSSTAAQFTAPCLGLKDAGVQSYDLAIATALVGRVAAECTQLGLKAQMIQPSTADSTLPGNPTFNGVAFTDNIIGFFVGLDAHDGSLSCRPKTVRPVSGERRDTLERCGNGHLGVRDALRRSRPSKWCDDGYPGVHQDRALRPQRRHARRSDSTLDIHPRHAVAPQLLLQLLHRGRQIRHT